LVSLLKPIAFHQSSRICRLCARRYSVESISAVILMPVAGLPITEYCDEHRMNTAARLQLFISVCRAVQHAHQRGIIHRDIKPSNVLLTMKEGIPIPKIIDFGLAKAIEKGAVEATLFTEVGAFIGTPEYMSPEQAGGLRGIDTRTDVYSLGVLLYELLVGSVPFDQKCLRGAGNDEIRRVIREDDPPSPTLRLGHLGEKTARVAECRNTDTQTLIRQIRGDLEWVLTKALEKDPDRRYASAAEFADDVRRHTNDEPVTAGPQSAAFRARRFMPKHRFPLLAAAFILASLLIAVAVTTVLYVRAESSRDVAAHEGYAARINAAALSLAAAHPEEARRQLMLCDPKLRGWEWRHLLFRSDPSVAVLKAHLYSLAF
jgi:eukaryotic-like serine/threonine-protein kinase